MNRQRRKEIEEIKDVLGELFDRVECLKEEEEEYLENMPDGIRESERGEAAEDAIRILEDALEEIDGAVSSLESAIE